MGIKTIYQSKSGDILTLIDLVDSPDDKGYYLEKWIFDLGNDTSDHWISSEVYKDKNALKTAYKWDNIKWVRR